MYNNKALIESDNKIDFYFEILDQGNFTTGISEAANISLSFDFEVLNVQGNNIADWSYDRDNRIINIRFSGPGTSEVSLDPTPFPVELISFSAILKGSNVLLTWTTASEINNYRFEIERSADRKQWKKIGEVKGNGTSTAPLDYSYFDTKIPKGNYSFYYRLKQIDFNGTFEYSEVKAIYLSAEKKNKTFRLFPNPASDYITVSIISPDFVEGVFVIQNTNGQVLRQIEVSNKSIIEVDIKQLPKGIYFCRILGGNQNPVSEKLIIY